MNTNSKTLNAISLLLILGSFISFFYYVLTSNIFDWAPYNAFDEVDRRIWLYEGSMPDWSYQYCAGSTRSGSPETFGLSPLFILVLLAGSVLGGKLLVYAGAIYAYYYVRKTFQLLSGNNFTGINKLCFYDLLPLFYIFGGFYAARFHVGHTPFVTTYLLHGLLYFLIKAFFYKSNWKDFAHGWVSFFLVFTGNFYHTTIFTLMPFISALGLYVLISATQKRSLADFYRPIKHTFFLFLTGTLACAYRLIPAIAYQLSSPRQIASVESAESKTLWQLLKNIFIPVADFNSYMFGLSKDGYWGIFENTAFSLAPLILILLLPQILKSRPLLTSANSRFVCFILIYVVVSFALALGNFHELAPLSLLNKYLFSGSVRCPARFTFNICLAFFLILPLLAEKVKLSLNHFFGCALLTVISAIYVYLPYFTYSLSSFTDLYNLPSSTENKMKIISLVPGRNRFNSYDFPALLLGHANPNCYNTLAREEKLKDLLQPAAANVFTHFPLVAISDPAESKECTDNVYMTHTRIHIPQTCRYRLCFNVNSISPDDRQRDGFYFDEQAKRYCFMPDKSTD